MIWGQKSNYLDIPTDCPQRDERLGWTGDAQVFIKTASYNYDVEKFFDKWLEEKLGNERMEKLVIAVAVAFSALWVIPEVPSIILWHPV